MLTFLSSTQWYLLIIVTCTYVCFRCSRYWLYFIATTYQVTMRLPRKLRLRKINKLPVIWLVNNKFHLHWILSDSRACELNHYYLFFLHFKISISCISKSILACLTLVGSTPFCRSKFCLAHQKKIYFKICSEWKPKSMTQYLISRNTEFE
jgi:hypothetical protein